MNPKREQVRIRRGNKIRQEKKDLQKQLKKDYEKYIKKNGGWPTAKKQQIIQKIC